MPIKQRSTRSAKLDLQHPAPADPRSVQTIRKVRFWMTIVLIVVIAAFAVPEVVRTRLEANNTPEPVQGPMPLVIEGRAG